LSKDELYSGKMKLIFSLFLVIWQYKSNIDGWWNIWKSRYK
jgi:hypothetical protein